VAADDKLDYERMMETALRGIVRAAISHAADRGLPGDHHFFVTFRTDLPGVGLPSRLRERYPAEMTIVIQYQFWGLEVGEDWFKVTLSFDGKHERLVIPLAAVTAFVDPSVQFGLQFPPRADEASATAPGAPAAASPALAPTPTPIEDTPPAPVQAPEDRVVLLDKFRKK